MMANNFSKTIIEGRVGRDPEWKDVGNGLCRFSVACSESWKNASDEWVEETVWYNVALWGKSGQYMMEKIHKGDRVLVSGRMKTNEHEGKTYWTLSPEMGGVTVLERKEGAASSKPAEPKNDDDDELPF